MNFLWKMFKTQPNVRWYYLLSFLHSLWFIEAAWYFYWARFLTYTQIGVFFSILVVVGLLAEIPTGYFADRYGRKNSVLLGTILLAFGSLLTASATHAIMLVSGVALMSIGRAFISGALEALVYDSLPIKIAQSTWDKISSLRVQISLTAYLIAVPIGGFLYQYFFRAPNLLEATSYFIAIWIATRFVEPTKKLSQKEPMVVGLNLSDLSVGFRELWRARIRAYLLPAFLILTVFTVYDWGLSKPAMAVNFGLDSRGQAIVYAGLALLNIVAVGLVPKLRAKWGDYWGLRMLNLVSGVAFIASTMIWGYWGIITMMLIEVTGNIGEPWTSSVVNAHTEGRSRATTLSTLAFLTKIPHFIVNILAGEAIDTTNINTFHIWLGVVILGCIALSLLGRRNGKTVVAS